MQTITISTPSDNLVVSQNGAAQPQTQESANAVEKLLKANTTLAIWLIFLGLGGGLLALYYIRIGYLPEMEWNAALVYLFVCSVWGGVIGLLLTISLYVPGVIWCEIIIFEPTLDNHLTFYADHDDPSGKRSRRKEPCIRSIMRYLGIPFAVALLISHVGLRVSGIRLIGPIDFYLIVAALILAGTSIYMRRKFRKRLLTDDCTDAEKLTRSRQIFRYYVWFTLSVLLNQIAMYVIYRLADRTPDNYDFAILTGICTLFVWISTHVVATRHRYYQGQALVAALVAAGVLLFTADRFSDLSMKLMSRYGIGEDKKFNLLVKKEAVELLSSEGVQACGPQHLCDVQILSRMGDHYFVRIGGKFNITLPKADVIAIRRLESAERAKN